MKSEDKIQQEIFIYFNNKYCLPSCSPREIMFHVPNEGKENGKLVSIGLYPGAADLIFTWKGQVIAFEVKAEKGVQSPNQKKFEAHWIATGNKYYIGRSLEDFIKCLDKNLT